MSISNDCKYMYKPFCTIPLYVLLPLMRAINSRDSNSLFLVVLLMVIDPFKLAFY